MCSETGCCTKKKRAPLPPPSGVGRCHKGSCTSDDFTQLSRRDSATSMGNGDVNYRFSSDNLTQGISQTSSQWSIYDDHLLTDSFSTITIKPRESYFEESSISENFLTPKALTPLLVRNEFSFGSPSVNSRRAPNPPSLTAANEIAPSVTEKSLSRDENSVDTDRIERENEPIGTREIPPVKNAQERTLPGALQQPSHTSASTPALASTSQKASTMQSVKASGDDSAFNLTHNRLKQARAALKSIPPRKRTTLPLRSTGEKNRPAFLSICDRSDEKDWDSRFWCKDRRSEALSFIISKG
ncbi:hypothetical protein TSMEX_004013 [Taenia solium]|eukprot:TsM_001168400 transcript=TsM_001168400 gene=TsM_001168400